MKYKAVLKSTKISTLIILWAGLIVSMVFLNNWWFLGLLIAVGIGVSAHVLTLKTIKKSEFKKSELNLKSIKSTEKHTES